MVLVLISVGALAADSDGNAVTAVTEGAPWPRVCPGELVCFSHPPGLDPVPQQAIDSVAGRYRSQVLSLSYDLGRYSSDFSELANPAVQPVEIDGRSGDILLSGLVMALRIPRVREGVRFSMALRFSGAVNQALGRRIFESIEFRLPEP